MTAYVKTCEEEGEDIIELPTESDGSLLFSTINAQYPGVTGLKFKIESTYRGVRLLDGKFHPPEGFWGKTIYYCVFPKENKRKCDDSPSASSVKTKRFDRNICSDLIVLGLPWKMDDSQLKSYFQTFGDVVMAMVKKDTVTGQSKGFGFIRYDDFESQTRALSKRHLIDGRWCDVKIPKSREGGSSRVPCKIFVGRLTQDITIDDVRNYFCQFGEVTDVYIPKPFRSFAFVTFENPEVAQSLYGEDHIVKGVSIHISEASPRAEIVRNTLVTNGVKSYQSYHRDDVRKWVNNQNPNANPNCDNPATAFLSALGLNPAVIAALNHAGWNLFNGGSNQSNSMPQQNQGPPPPSPQGAQYSNGDTYRSAPPPPPPPNWCLPQDSWVRHPHHHQHHR